jgi:hypothetical protein
MAAEFTKLSGEAVAVREQTRSTAISSVTAVAEMRALGFGGTAHTKRIPGWVFCCARDLQFAFLRGFLDGDGHVNRRGWITWTSVNRDLIEDIRHLCMVAGIPVGEACPYPIKKKFDGELRADGAFVWQAWSYSVEHNREIGSHDPRYIERWRDTPNFKGRGVRANRPGEGFDIKGAKLSKIASIQPAGEAVPVYDLEVDGVHNFLADGVVVHNSGIEQLMIGWLTLNLRPLLASIEQAIEKQLLPAGMRKNIYPEFNLDGLLRADSAGRAALYSVQAQNGLKTRNEMRRRENDPPLPGGDVLTVQSNLIPLAELGHAPPTPTPPDFGTPPKPELYKPGLAQITAGK